jgi:hypothetical protein
MATPDDCPMIGLADKDVIAEGFVAGFRQIVADDALFEAASHKLFVQLSGHTVTHARQWLGAKILTAIGAALFAAGLWLIVRFGPGK